MRISHSVVSIGLIAALCLVPVQGSVAAETASTPDSGFSLTEAQADRASFTKEFKNCTALNKVYKHGVGKKGAKDKVKGSGKRVTNFKVDTKVYNQNKKSDRDKDGVACEKK